ncbi:unnamed protein product [Caenorhabditis auriculariae]|uniref:Uncharacterized protein n=1 Tax=Caenorhabditis auriculariae TaxID=2777116 RepID=A0A8S1GPP5_9PELO|nr:unnamed protein product [Caenorhabditis auriculariae]
MTLANLILISKAAPNLRELVLWQSPDVNVLENATTFALPYFKNLESLTLLNWESRNSAARGCAYRSEIAPILSLKRLRKIKISCQGSTASQFLKDVRKRNGPFHFLEIAELSLNCEEDLGNLQWLESRYPHLRVVRN